MTAKQRSTFTFADWMTDRILRGLIFGLLKLPYRQRVALMGAAMRYVIGPLSGYRKRAERNLALVYPQMSAQERRAIANGCCDNFGRTIIENYAPKELAMQLRDSVPHGPGIDAITKARAKGQPVMCVSGHFANFDVPRHALDAMGHPVALLYRPMRNGYFNAHYATSMSGWGGPVFAQGRPGSKNFIHHIRDGGIGTLLFDISAPGPALPFLGHPARTSLSTAQIALDYGALVVPYFAVRQADGISFDIAFEEPIAPATPQDMLVEMTARLEKRIAAHPEQWFWIHRRWKT